MERGCCKKTKITENNKITENVQKSGRIIQNLKVWTYLLKVLKVLFDSLIKLFKSIALDLGSSQSQSPYASFCISASTQMHVDRK